MKSFVTAFAAVIALAASSAWSAEIPFNLTQFDAMRASGKPMAVVFHADWCPTCRAQAPVLKQLMQSPEFSGVTLFVADFDTDKTLKQTLAVAKQSTVVVFKDGKESARSTGDTREPSLAALLRHAIS
jgi:thiol-disulfide isomerase/thioredoxin